MAINVYEIQGREQSRSKLFQPMEQGGATKRKYRIEGEVSMTEADARTELYNETPNMVDNMFRDAMQIEEIAPGLYEGEVTYTVQRVDANQRELMLNAGEFRVRINAGTTMKHVTHGMTRAVAYPPRPTGELTRRTGEPMYSATTVDEGHEKDKYRGAIGVEYDGDNLSVNGIDIPVATLHMSITIARNSARLATMSFWKDIARMTGKINPSPFMGFEAGEVMLMGGTTEVSSKHFQAAYQQYKDPQIVEVTYEFAMSENMYNFPMSQIALDYQAPVIIPFKGGWDVVDVTTRPMGKADWKTIIPVIESVQVIQVHDVSAIDFNDIWRA